MPLKLSNFQKKWLLGPLLIESQRGGILSQPQLVLYMFNSLLFEPNCLLGVAKFLVGGLKFIVQGSALFEGGLQAILGHFQLALHRGAPTLPLLGDLLLLGVLLFETEEFNATLGQLILKALVLPL